MHGNKSGNKDFPELIAVFLKETMKIPIYQIDAFTSTVFKGNPAAVCPLTSWLDDRILQAIAMENNLSETAFIVDMGDHYQIRWFTPEVEVDLCGHATLASAYVIFHYVRPGTTSVRFLSKSGSLSVTEQENLVCLDFPVRKAVPCPPPDILLQALRMKPQEILAAHDYLAVYENEEDIRGIQPDYALLKQLDRLGVIITAPGQESDFVSRFFAPKAGIPEDPVTGSAHCTLTPYWAERLRKNSLVARQISARGGELFCDYRGNKVLIAGQAVCYLEGWIRIEP